MSLYPGSARLVGAANPVDVVLVDALGNPVFGFNPSKPSAATLTQPTVNATSSVIAASNPARRGLVSFNDAGRKVFIAFAATATVTAYTVELANQATYELPKDGYTGDVSAITASGSGTVRVTELS